MRPFAFPGLELVLDPVLASTPITYCEIGARDGARLFHAIGRYIRYYGFEPDKHEAARLRRDLQGVFADVHVLPHAVMDKPGEVVISVLRHRGCSSVLTPSREVIDRYSTRRGDTVTWPDFFDVVGTYRCDARSLDEVAQTEGIAELDFLQVDTQGTELAIFKGGSVLLSRTAFVHVEMETVPLYRDQPLLPEVVCWLEQAGFRLIRLEKQEAISRSPAPIDDYVDQGELVSVDGLFYRDYDPPLAALELQPHTALRRMLLLHELGFRTFAIDTGRRCLERCANPSIQALVDAMIARYARDNEKARPLRRKIGQTRIGRMLKSVRALART